jgi:GST-like protein
VVWSSSDIVDAALHHAPLAEHAHGELRALLDVLDARLADRPYMLGDDYSLVDLVVGDVITYATYTGVSVDGHARVSPWLERVQARASFRSAWSPA